MQKRHSRSLDYVYVCICLSVCVLCVCLSVCLSVSLSLSVCVCVRCVDCQDCAEIEIGDDSDVMTESDSRNSLAPFFPASLLFAHKFR